MLRCELDVMEYNVTMTELEAEQFLDWLYDDFDEFDTTNSELYKLCTSETDVTIDTLNLTIYDDCMNEIYRGKAIDYPYDWFDIQIVDHSWYNIENDVYLDVWGDFPKWR